MATTSSSTAASRPDDPRRRRKRAGRCSLRDSVSVGVSDVTRGRHSSDGVWTEHDLPGGGCLRLLATDDIKPSADSGSSSAECEIAELEADIGVLRYPCAATAPKIPCPTR